MLKKMNNMNIKGRLNYVFRLIIIAFSVVAVVISAMMIYMSMDYRRVLKRYAFPQGDIATAMSEAAEIRGASRGVVGYDSVSLISSMKKQHDEHVEAFEAKLEQIRPIMSSKAGKECMDKIDKAWAEYKEIDEKVIKLGATTDSNQSLKAQSMMLNETAPKYEALDNALNELMDTNVAKGDAGRGFAVVADQIRTLAEQSAKSAVDSRNLIEASIYEVGEGNKIATKASDSLKEVVDGVQSIAESAKKMRDVSTSQAAGMEQADVAIARIAEVVQANSATSQETSATSEELTAQATTLSEMVAQFKLRND